MAEPQRLTSSDADPFDSFLLRCEVRAYLWSLSEYSSMAEAVDEQLQQFAVESGLVRTFGQDLCQQVMSSAFARYQDDVDEDDDEWHQGAALEVDAGNACEICNSWPCTNPAFCRRCRQDDVDAPPSHALKPHRERPTPRTTIEALLYCIRERGPDALCEPVNVERLSRCDTAALAEIRSRVIKFETEAA